MLLKPSRDICTDPYEIYGAVLPELCKGGYSGPEWPHTPLSDTTLSRMLVDQFFSIPGDPGKSWHCKGVVLAPFSPLVGVTVGRVIQGYESHSGGSLVVF